jgi:hypothetical protein
MDIKIQFSWTVKSYTVIKDGVFIIHIGVWLIIVVLYICRGYFTIIIVINAIAKA